MTPEAIATLHQQLLSTLGSAPDEARRLFHGRGRRWPGLEHITVDWLQGLLLVSLFREPEAAALASLEAMLQALTDTPLWQEAGAHGLLLQHRDLPGSPLRWLQGTAHDTWVIGEDGLSFKLDLGRNQNTGLFLDMRHGRQWVREQARGKRVLNLFAYTCGFSVAAIAGGAEQVVNLDMASAPLSRGRENHRLNGHDLGRVSFLAHDLFKSWGKLKRSAPYDLIIIDPPSFQKGSFALDKDYRKILRRLPDLLAERGQVLACVNDPGIGPGFLVEGMAEEAPGLAFRQRLENPPEFADIHPDSGLKALVFAQGHPAADGADA